MRSAGHGWVATQRFSLIVTALLSAMPADAVHAPIQPILCDCATSCPAISKGNEALDRYIRGETDGTVFTDPLLADPLVAGWFALAYRSHRNASPDLVWDDVTGRRIRYRTPLQCLIVPCGVPRPFAPSDFGFVFDVLRFQPQF